MHIAQQKICRLMVKQKISCQMSRITFSMEILVFSQFLLLFSFRVVTFLLNHLILHFCPYYLNLLLCHLSNH